MLRALHRLVQPERRATSSRCVRWLGSRSGTRPLALDVVPLFETGADLDAADTTLEEWMGLTSTQAWLDGGRPARSR